MPNKELPYQDPMQDGRRKLHPSQYAEVRAVYQSGCSYRATAEMFGVSKRLVYYIVHPEKLEQYRKEAKEKKAWAMYYTTEKRKEYVRRYRAKKRMLGFMESQNKNNLTK